MATSSGVTDPSSAPLTIAAFPHQQRLEISFSKYQVRKPGWKIWQKMKFLPKGEMLSRQQMYLCPRRGMPLSVPYMDRNQPSTLCMDTVICTWPVEQYKYKYKYYKYSTYKPTKHHHPLARETSTLCMGAVQLYMYIGFIGSDITFAMKMPSIPCTEAKRIDIYN